MAGWQRFVLRVLLSLILAFIIGRVFFQGASLSKTGVLALAMLGFAYLFEYTRKKDGK